MHSTVKDTIDFSRGTIHPGRILTPKRNDLEALKSSILF